jgi:hypothetical protein
MKEFCWIVALSFFFVHPAYSGTLELPKRNDTPWKNLRIGQAYLSLGGTYRLRSEFQHKYNIQEYGTGENEEFLLSRLRLDLDLKFRNLRTFVQFQDARIFGSSFDDSDFATSNPYHDDMDIRQAYIDYEPRNHLEIKLGRQEIAFADRRIFGPGNWGNTGRYVWDAARLRFHNSKIDTHCLVGRYIIGDPDRWPNKHADGPTAYANYTMIRNLPFDLDVFYVVKRDDHGDTQGESGEGDLTSHSVGFRMGGTSGPWDYSWTVVRQFGWWGEDKIRAYGLAASLGYTFDLPWNPHLMVQFINGSGDDDPKDGRKGTFDGVFSGADTVLYGWMNMFFWSNIREYRIDTELSPTDKLSFRFEYHYFTLDQKKDAWYYPGKAQRRDETGASSRELGHEIDLTFHYKAAHWFDIRSGYCLFFPGDFIKKTGPDPDASWAFFQTVFSF